MHAINRLATVVAIFFFSYNSWGSHKEISNFYELNSLLNFTMSQKEQRTFKKIKLQKVKLEFDSIRFALNSRPINIHWALVNNKIQMSLNGLTLSESEIKDKKKLTKRLNKLFQISMHQPLFIEILVPKAQARYIVRFPQRQNRGLIHFFRNLFQRVNQPRNIQAMRTRQQRPSRYSQGYCPYMNNNYTTSPEPTGYALSIETPTSTPSPETDIPLDNTGVDFMSGPLGNDAHIQQPRQARIHYRTNH